MVKVLKIGGSILTDKAHLACARMNEIERVAEEIARSPENLIFVHGAGSFGHAPAKKYGLPGKFDPEGLRKTHSCVAKLNSLVMDALAKAGANPMQVHPLSSVILQSGRIRNFAVEPIVEMVKRGLMPVLHGDVAMDISNGAGIVSGDQLVSYLAKALKAEVIAVGTDRDGVIFEDAPLNEITRERLAELGSALGGSSAVDVTGGMRGKLLELLDLADSGSNSIIFNASKEGLITRALKGEPVGTLVRA
ncbi:MAG: isopentenyl phosphate kinase [Methanotrichaceae archaeon]